MGFGFLTRQVLERCFTKGMRLARSACSTASFKKFRAWICSNLVEKRSERPAAAEQQQTAAATARPVAARWKHKYKQFFFGTAAAAQKRENARSWCGPRGATRRFQSDSPVSGAASTLCPAAAQMTATKRISDVLFPRGFEVASPRRSPRAAEGQSLGINFPGPSPLPPALEAGAQQRAKETR